MFRRGLAPAQLIACAILIALLFAVSMTWIAVRQPWLGLSLVHDMQNDAAIVRDAQGPAAAIARGTALREIAGAGDRLRFVANDFVVEPDGSIGSYAAYDAFLARQARIQTIKESGAVTLGDGEGRRWHVVPAASRPILTLPPEYWVQLFVGVVAWLTSAAIWAFRRGESSARYLLLSGFCTLVFAPFAAVYGAREIAMPVVPLEILDSLNFLGGSLFIAALVALLLSYPKRIAPPWVGWAIVAAYIGWYAAQELGAFTSMTAARRVLVLAGVIATFGLAAIHWRGTRADPIARASLQWFLLSWLLGVTVFCSMIFVPQLFGIDTSNLQPYGFLLFLLIYGGLAFGIIRYRLFDLGAWWAGAMVWAVTVVSLVLLDMAFLLGLQLSSELSLALSLLICGLIWLPLRGLVWRRMLARTPIDERGQFEGLVATAFANEPDDQAGRWRALLAELFAPLRIEALAGEPAVGIAEDGLSLIVPAASGLPAYRLSYAQRGTRLFTPADIRRAATLADMLAQLLTGRSAFEAGVEVERRRIAVDIHDNIGATLLSALHSVPADRKDWLIREALLGLRTVIEGATGPDQSLADALAPIRRETAERLELHRVRLDWVCSADDLRDLPSTHVHALRSILREATSNMIKHAHGTRLRIRIEDGDGVLLVRIEDDGVGFDADTATANGGNGIANMRNRAQALGGDFVWEAQQGAGTRCTIRLPCPGMASATAGFATAAH